MGLVMERPFPVLLLEAAVIKEKKEMALRTIRTEGDSVLEKICRPVEKIDKRTKDLVGDMLETMYAAPGIGLAAVQVAVPKRLVVLDVAGKDEEPSPIAMINPEIVRLGDQTRVYEEGCLSLPEVRLDIERPTTLTVAYIDRDGKQQTLEAGGLVPYLKQRLARRAGAPS